MGVRASCARRAAQPGGFAHPVRAPQGAPGDRHHRRKQGAVYSPRADPAGGPPCWHEQGGWAPQRTQSQAEGRGRRPRPAAPQGPEQQLNVMHGIGVLPGMQGPCRPAPPARGTHGRHLPWPDRPVGRREVGHAVISLALKCLHSLCSPTFLTEQFAEGFSSYAFLTCRPLPASLAQLPVGRVRGLPVATFPGQACAHLGLGLITNSTVFTKLHPDLDDKL